jgi:drug/metabolite transporter (DMT)-like permease
VARFRVWFAFAALSGVWGSSYLFIRIGLRQLTPISLVALRLLSAAIGVFLLAVLSRQELRVTRRQFILMVILANVNIVIPFLLITWGETRITSGLAAVFNSITPIFSVLIAGIVLSDERITGARLGGVALGFGGVLLLVSRDLGQGGIYLAGIVGQGAVALAALSYAIGAVFARRTLRGIPPMAIAAYTVIVAAVETTVLAFVAGFPSVTHLDGSTTFAVLWLGLLGSAVAYGLYYFIMENWGAARTTLVTYMLPAVGLTLGAVFLGEVVDWRILAGSALVVCGVVLASLVRRPRDAAAMGEAGRDTVKEDRGSGVVTPGQ